MSRDSHPPVIPFSVATLGIATFAGMDVLMKGLAIEMGAYNAIMWRMFIALGLAAVLYAWKGRGWPRASSLKIHIWRGLVTSLMAFLFFWGLIYVPLAEAIALSFIAPLIALYLAALLLGEHVGAKSIAASLIGFAGALTIIAGKLSGEYSADVGWGIAAILLSAVLYSYNLILQRQQALLAGPVEIALFQSATVVAVYLLFSPFLAIVPPLAVLPQLMGAAVLGLLSVMLLSWAYARAQARVLIPVEYTAFVWAALFGWLVYGEHVTAATYAGTALIVTGCLVAARQQDVVEHVETTAV